MIRIAKTTAAVATALMLGAGVAAQANADSAWPDVGERADNVWTPGDGEPQPMDRSYFADQERAADAVSANAKRDGDAGEDGFFAKIVDAIQRAGESG